MFELTDRIMNGDDETPPTPVLSRRTPWAWRSLASAAACLALVGLAFVLPGEADYYYVVWAGVSGLLALGCALLGLVFAAVGVVRREGWGCFVGAVACLFVSAPASALAGGFVLLVVTSPLY